MGNSLVESQSINSGSWPDRLPTLDIHFSPVPLTEKSTNGIPKVGHKGFPARCEFPDVLPALWC